jgi:hypothetical protein
VQSWSYKNQNENDNDEVEILGIFQHLSNAYDFMNHRYRFYLMEKHRSLVKSIFPRKSERQRKKKVLQEHYGELVADKVLSYLYGHLDRALVYCQPIEGKEYAGQPVVMNLELDSIYLQLMAFQKWISNQTEEAFFPEYTDIELYINDDVKGLARKISSNSCRIYIYDTDQNQLTKSFYLGDNLLDLEDCEHRERHFCSSYRIHTKTLRD